MKLKLTITIHTALIWNTARVQTLRLWETNSPVGNIDSMERLLNLKFFLLFAIILMGRTVQAQLSKNCSDEVALSPHSRIYGSKKDQHGNVYVFGKNGPNPYIIKYGVNCDTTVLLNDRTKINGKEVPNDSTIDSAFVSDIAFGEDSAIYVTGVHNVYSDPTGISFLLKIKNQDTVWSKSIINWELTYLAATRWYYVTKITYNPFDSCVYMASTAIKNGSNHDVLTMKFDLEGNLLNYQMQEGYSWYPGLEDIHDIICKDSAIIISARSQVPGGFNLLTYQYDTALVPEWKLLEGQLTSKNYPLGLDVIDNSVFILAETKDSLVINPKTATIIKYGIDQGKLWRMDFNLSSKSTDVPQNFSVDQYGNIAVAVISSDSLNYKRAFIVLYDSAGNHTGTIEEEDSVSFFQVAIQQGCNIVSYLKKEGQSVSRTRKYCNYGLVPTWTSWDSVTVSPFGIFFADSAFTIVSANAAHTGLRSWTDQAIISPPGSISLLSKEARFIEFSWIPSSSSIQGYYILRGTAPDNLTHLDTVGAQTTQYKDSGLVPSTRYYYRIAAFGTPCDYCASSVFSDSTLFNTSIENVTKPEISVYPNPVLSELNIVTDLSAFEYTLYDVLGKARISGKDAVKVPVQFLESGIYFLTIKTENHLSRTYKILKL